MCEAVVQLGPDLTVKAPAAILEARLLRAPSTAGMQGTCFVDLIAGPDQERCLQCLGVALWPQRRSFTARVQIPTSG